MFVHEGHPLNWLWACGFSSHRLDESGRGYFDERPRPNESFPATAVSRFTSADERAPDAWEWPWTLGEVVAAVAGAGLQIEHLEEHANHFWNQFPDIGSEEMARLPHSYSLLARRPSE